MSGKECFVIPRLYYGTVTSTEAHITKMTPTRVIGNVVYVDYEGVEISTPFDVKHDGKTFAIGSGSSKARYYFKNRSKE